MALPREQIALLVDEIIKQLDSQGALGAASPRTARGGATAAGINPGGIYPALDAAVSAARAAQARLMELGLERRKEIIAGMRQAAREHARSLAEHAVRETGLGRVSHKTTKNLTAADKTPGVEDLLTVSWSGDGGLTVVERAPFGVIGAITPTTNPTATIINNSLSLVAGGNAAVYCFHPNARNCGIQTVELLNAAIVAAGGPASLLTAVAEPSIETAQALMRHSGIDALLVTGGGAVVQQAMVSGKKVWAAGPGNPPTVVDETADLELAAKHIVDGASFDNTVLCTAEKEAIVVGAVADRLKALMQQQGAHEVAWSEVDRLQRYLLPDGKHVQKDAVGKDAALILRQAGISFSGEPRLAFCEVPADHPFVWTEMLLPVLPVVRVKTAAEAIELAIRAEKGHKHTASIHSNDLRNLSHMAREFGGSIFVKNGPHYAGIGVGGEGYATLSIAGTTGEGLTSARTFTKERRCVLVGHFRIV